MPRLDAGDLGRTDALIWPAPTPSHAVAAAVDDGIRLDEFGDAPAKQVRDLLAGGVFHHHLGPAAWAGGCRRSAPAGRRRRASVEGIIPRPPSGTTSARFCLAASAGFVSA